MSKKVTFNIDDFNELIHIVHEHLDKDELNKDSLCTHDHFIHKEVLRPSKIYHMLANRACRQSIMVGKDLDLKLMTKVL